MFTDKFPLLCSFGETGAMGEGVQYLIPATSSGVELVVICH